MTSTFEEELKRSGRLVYTNVGVSMMPLLREKRDIMVIEPAADYHVMDAVLFRRPSVSGRGAYVLHRIVRICPDGRYWIVWDNCVSGEFVERKHILGVMTAVIRDGKEIKATDRAYRLYVALWCRPYRLRAAILRPLFFARRCLGKLKRMIMR